MADEHTLDEQNVAGVSVGFWNPLREDGAGRTRRVNNMGDLLGPLVTQLALAHSGWVDPVASAEPPRRLLTIGSIAHFARSGDVMWGTGVNGKALAHTPRKIEVDIRAVRGPWTAAELTHRGYHVPPVFGDPALLLGSLMPEIPRLPGWEGLRLVVPNFNSFSEYRDQAETLAQRGLTLLSPEMPLFLVLSAIAHAEFVVGSSLHAVILADAYGVPARIIRSGAEPEFKYYDYLLGSGRTRPRLARDVSEALDLGAHEKPEFDAPALTDAFPRDLWDPGHPLAGGSHVFSIAPEALSLWRERATRRATREELAARVEGLVRDAAAQDGAPFGGRNAIADVRRIALPDVHLDLGGLGAEDVDAATPSARMRDARVLSRDLLLGVSLVHDSAIDWPELIELHLEDRENSRRVDRVWHLFEQQRGQWRLDLDFLVPLEELADGAQWRAFVRIDGELVPVTDGVPVPLSSAHAPSDAGEPVLLSPGALTGVR
ncbi:polysaccharide pyruvyl transferase family protein [Microbacterium sp.]|uniref:polysaccharide pyruvyl transferase family protein n=1 Tax=Microbacterium sp. TaxID=51671 RepID=UPI0028119F09|nr:polysaccharide pyruvyl transferase family protein [Microbacterium sp.]